jgi:hypothetical protein
MENCLQGAEAATVGRQPQGDVGILLGAATLGPLVPWTSWCYRGALTLVDGSQGVLS